MGIYHGYAEMYRVQDLGVQQPYPEVYLQPSISPLNPKP